MKKANSIIEKIKELLPYLAPLTIFAYISTITLQFGYYNAFGIDLFIFTPRIDPTSLVGIVVPISMGILGVLEVLFLRKAAKSKSLALPIVEDVVIGGILAGGALVYILNPQNLHEKVGLVGPYVQYFFLIILIAAIAKRVHDIRRYTKGGFLEPKKSIKEAYIETSFFKPSKRAQKKKKESLGELLTGGTFALLITIAVLPYAVGEAIAKDRSKFSELTTPTPEKDLKTIVIGQSSDGYIIKNYNINKRKYESGWGVYKEDVVRFQPIDIKSLNTQADN